MRRRHAGFRFRRVRNYVLGHQDVGFIALSRSEFMDLDLWPDLGLRVFQKYESWVV